MKFINDGPDIPENLLLEHEEGNVIFFCGAGISCNADLPTFENLIDKILVAENMQTHEFLQKLKDRNEYDRVINYLDSICIGGRTQIRKDVYEILQPNLEAENALKTHKSLLYLSKNSNNSTCIVTTNYDHLFIEAAKQINFPLNEYIAPLLPVPKKNKWNGVVYLHGRLPYSIYESEPLNSIVISSGDFGIAYLIERWAVRFIEELIRNYSLCFIGYSLKDPILRYIIDALAADRMQGIQHNNVWIFAGYNNDEQNDIQQEWEFVGVSPILYKIISNNHNLLHETLHEWARIYKNGIYGKNDIISKYANRKLDCLLDDDIHRVLWAMSDMSGCAAKCFSEISPTPSLEWLNILSTFYIINDYILKFNYSIDESKSIKTFKTFTTFKTSISIQTISIFRDNNQNNKYEKIIFYLRKWVMKYLGNPLLIMWCIKNNTFPQGNFADDIFLRINQYARYKKEKNYSKLSEIYKMSDCAIPSDSLDKIWRYILTNKIKNRYECRALFILNESIDIDGLSENIISQIKNVFSPCIVLKESYNSIQESQEQTLYDIKHFFNWEYGIKANNFKYDVFLNDKKIFANIYKYINIFESLLLESLNLQKSLGDANNYHDRSYLDLPSIEDHAQNFDFCDWVVLIKLVRDSWLSLKNIDYNKAKYVANLWYENEFPTFKRLAFFAASRHEGISSDVWVNWLLEDNNKWLWLVETRREVFRLLARRGAYLSLELKQKLEKAIIKGPTLSINKTLDPIKRSEYIEYAIWHRLAKLKYNNCELSNVSSKIYDNIIKEHPDWKLENNEKDEFISWVGDVCDIEKIFYANHKVPNEFHELKNWMVANTSRIDNYDHYIWNELCYDRFEVCCNILCELIKENNYSIDQFGICLEKWAQDDFIWDSWNYFSKFISSIDEICKIKDSVALWIESSSKLHDINYNVVINICKKLINSDNDSQFNINESIEYAFNSYIFNLINSLLNILFNEHINEKLQNEILDILSGFICSDNERNITEKIILSYNIISLFNINSEWTKNTLLNLLIWKSNKNTIYYWVSFLMNFSYNNILFDVVKYDFLECAKHFDELQNSKSLFVRFLTLISIYHPDHFEREILQKTFFILPADAIIFCFEYIKYLFQNTDDKNRFYNVYFLEFWNNIFPQSKKFKTDSTAETLANICIVYHELFPELFNCVKNWLCPLKSADYFIIQIERINICDSYPNEALDFINLIISDKIYVVEELKKCIESIQKSKNFSIVNDYKIKKLLPYIMK